MDDHQLKDLTPDGSSDAVRCLICLNTFSGQPVASPQHCNHVYCLVCITEWAKTSNSCPVDRQKFTVLYQRSCPGRVIQKIIMVEPHDDQEIEGERFEELSVCEECGRSDRRHLMLLCSACDSRFHTACLHPPLAVVPVEDWFCLECTTAGNHTNDTFSRDEGEITETELTELVSDVVRTSSRLRPSTTSHPGISVHNRRSERVQQQSRRTHTSLSRTAQHVPRYLLKSSWSNTRDVTTSSLIPNTQEAEKKVIYKKTRRRKTDRSDSM